LFHTFLFLSSFLSFVALLLGIIRPLLIEIQNTE